MSLRDKIFATDFDGWNNEPSMWTVALLGGVGGGAGFGTANALSFEQPFLSVVTAIVTGLVVFAGFGVLAFLD